MTTTSLCRTATAMVMLATGTTVVATTAGCNSRASFQSVTVGLAIPLGALAQPVRRVAR